MDAFNKLNQCVKKCFVRASFIPLQSCINLRGNCPAYTNNLKLEL
jgi:hypothetical protein